VLGVGAGWLSWRQAQMTAAERARARVASA
jgi:hypothetical protein